MAKLVWITDKAHEMALTLIERKKEIGHVATLKSVVSEAVQRMLHNERYRKEKGGYYAEPRNTAPPPTLDEKPRYDSFLIPEDQARAKMKRIEEQRKMNPRLKTRR